MSSSSESWFSQAELAANKWINDNPSVHLILSDENERRMYFEMNGSKGTFDIQQQLTEADRCSWVVKSECDDQRFLEEAKKLCASNSNLTIEALLDCIVSQTRQEVTSGGKTCDEDEILDNDEDDEYMAGDDLQDEYYYNDDSESAEKSTNPPPYNDEEFDRFARGGNPSAIKRLLADMKSLNSSEGKFGVSGTPRGDNLFVWDVKLTDFEPKSQLAKDLVTYSNKYHREAAIRLEMKFPDAYPMAPPFVRVTRPRFKFLTGHVTIGGSICMQMLTRSGWSPGNDIEGILIQIRSEIMSDPDVRLDLNRDAEYTEAEAKDAFQRMVAKYNWN